MKKCRLILVVLIVVQLFLLSSCQLVEKQGLDTNANTPEYVQVKKGSNGITIKEITFDDLAPEGLDLEQCWDAMGMDDQERVYLGWTSKRSDGREDFAVFRYDNATGERKFLGTFMDASAAANNLAEGEEIPKGHTRMIFLDGKMYMGSQSFHDFKQLIDDLPKYRGSHLYAYDTKTDKLEDISAGLPDGVVTKNQGIVAMTYLPGYNYLVGLAHPHSDIVLFNPDAKKVEKIVPGIPWQLGNPLSREIVATKYGKIYTYRGTEELKQRYEEYNMWEYDVKTDEMKMTDYKFTGGFWNGQTETKDGEKIYLTTVNGELYVLHTKTGEVEHLGHFLPEEDYKKGKEITYLYSITLSRDEKKIYAIPSVDHGNLYAYDIASKKVSMVTEIGDGIYTGGSVIDSKDNLYFARFDEWSGNCKLLVIDVSKYK